MDQELSHWLDRIRIAKEDRAHHAAKWERLRLLLIGPNFRDDVGHQANNPLNAFKSYHDVVLPMLFSGNPDFTVTAKQSGEDRRQVAEFLGDCLSALAREIHLGVPVREALGPALYSAGLLKVGYFARTNMVRQIEGRGGTGKVTVDVDRARGREQEYHDGSLPYVEHVSASRFCCDPSATSLDNARWSCHEIYRTMQDLLADPEFKAAIEKQQIKGTHQYIPRDDNRQDEMRADPQLEYVQLYEIYDLHSRQILYVGGERCGAGAVLKKVPLDLGFEGHPFTMFRFSIAEKYFWPNPPMAAWAHLANGYDQLLDHIISNASQAKEVVLVDTNIAPNLPEQLRSARDQAVIAVPNLGQAVQRVQIGGIHADHIRAADLLERLIDKSSGISDLMRGVPEAGQQTATEVMSRKEASSARLGDMKAEVRRALTEVGQRLAAILFRYKDELRSISLPLQRGSNNLRYVSLDPDKFVGDVLEYAFSVEPGSIEHTDRDLIRQRDSDAVGLVTNQVILQGLAGQQTQVNWRDLVVEVLRNRGMVDPDRLFIEPQQQQPPGQPGGAGGDGAAQQEASSEDEAMVQGQPVEPQPGQDHQGHVQQHVQDLQMLQQQQVDDAILQMIQQHMQQHAAIYQQESGQAEQSAEPPAEAQQV